MFFKTQIKSVCSNGVVDIAGRNLTFVGYLPVKAGDWVFTDGRVIFGNAPPKGSSAVFDEPSGIPVLGDQYLLADDTAALRGYFSRHGTFKKFPVAQDDWIANADKKFSHGTEFLNGEKVIDADFSDKGDNLIATKFISQLLPDDEDYYWGLFYFWTFWTESSSYIYPVSRVQFAQDDFSHLECFSTDLVHRYFHPYNPTPVICSFDKPFLDGWPKAQNIMFPDYVRSYQPLAKFNFIMRGSSLDYRLFDDNIIKQCEILIYKNSNVIERINIADFLKDFEDAAKNEVDILSGEVQIPWQSVKHIISRAVVDNFKILSDYSWELLLQVEIFASKTFFVEWDSIDYWDNPTTLDDFQSAVFHDFFLLKINSAGLKEKIFDWHFAHPPTFLVTFFDIIPDPECAKIHIDFPDYFFFPVQNIYQAKLTKNGFDTVSDSDYISIKPLWNLSGIFRGDELVINSDFTADEKTSAHKWNLSLAEFKKKNFLFGIHKDIDKGVDKEIGGKLYQISEDETKIIADGLKNFRLRELNKISKSRR